MATLLHSKYPRCHEQLAKWESVRGPQQMLLVEDFIKREWDENHWKHPDEKDWLHYKWEGWPLPEIESKWGEGYAHKNLTTHHLTESGESYLYGVKSQRPREWDEKQNRKDTK